ncbi:MAG: EcsC family protein [Propionibacteriaceae bacterium]
MKTVRSALEQARDPQNRDEGAIASMVQQLLDIGIDGKGPTKSAREIAEKALSEANGDVEEAIDAIVKNHVSGAAAGGFVTSLGGFITMPIAIPANIVEFYLQATRMVAAIAHLRGYDIDSAEIRSAVLLTLSGQSSSDILAKVGIVASGGAVTSLLSSRLPKSALMILNKAIGFRLLRTVGEKSLARLGRGIPLAGVLIGAGMDGYLGSKIASSAKRDFVKITTTDTTV